MAEYHIPRPLCASVWALTCKVPEGTLSPITLGEAFDDLQRYYDATHGHWRDPEARGIFNALLTDVAVALWETENMVRACRIVQLLHAHARSCGPEPTLGFPQ